MASEHETTTELATDVRIVNLNTQVLLSDSDWDRVFRGEYSNYLEREDAVRAWARKVLTAALSNGGIRGQAR